MTRFLHHDASLYPGLLHSLNERDLTAPCLAGPGPSGT
ncbi:hypothetical protein ASAP_0785 [Asaia bogorensis]|uniref:Uncharacterized protein n=1 Tax=Asaia bogorensis TaxID=91915 RepID=A0A060QD32_9PROT|nr:hypothetical protein ASAP_0785 [Asaia bogorensis]